MLNSPAGIYTMPRGALSALPLLISDTLKDVPPPCMNKVLSERLSPPGVQNAAPLMGKLL